MKKIKLFFLVVSILYLSVSCGRQPLPHLDTDLLIDNLVLISYTSDYETRLNNVQSIIPSSIQSEIKARIAKVKPSLEIFNDDYIPEYIVYSKEIIQAETSVLIKVHYKEVKLLQQPMTTLIFLQYEKGVVVSAQVLDLFDNFNHSPDWVSG